MESVLNREMREAEALERAAGARDHEGRGGAAGPPGQTGAPAQVVRRNTMGSILTDKEALMIRIIQVLKKHPLKRTEEDVEMVIPYMKEVKFFKERDINKQKALDYPDIVTALHYEHFQEGECIMHWGELGDKFYILLKG